MTKGNPLLSMCKENMRANRILCPCCGKDYIEEAYDICLTCGWEYDPIQNDTPDYRGGANKDSLIEHRDWFMKMLETNKAFGWCDTWRE